MGLWKSYESDKCSSEEPVEMLSEESLLGSDDCALVIFSFQLSNPAEASNTNPAMCKVFWYVTINLTISRQRFNKTTINIHFQRLTPNAREKNR